MNLQTMFLREKSFDGYENDDEPRIYGEHDGSVRGKVILPPDMNLHQANTTLPCLPILQYMEIHTKR